MAIKLQQKKVKPPSHTNEGDSVRRAANQRLQIIGKLACSVPIDQEKKHHAKSDKIGKEKKREKR